MAHEVRVVCTGADRLDGPAQHGRIDFTTLDFHLLDDGRWIVNERGTRLRPFPTDGPQVVTWVDEDGTEQTETATIGSKAVEPVAPTRKVSGGWRWKCPKCRRDRPMSEVTLLRWRDTFPEKRVLDISHLPR